MLSIVATPIGNLKDISLRSLETLQATDGIICEDTRVSGKLLSHYRISKPLTVLNDYNEAKQIPLIIARLKTGQNLVLISDAGTPLISDPGFKLVRQCLREGIPIDSLPGPSAPITALTLSGLPPDKFMFWGFLPDKAGHRQKSYQQIKDISAVITTTFILFAAPFKLARILAEMLELFGDIDVTLTGELTKMFQSIRTARISVFLDEFKKHPPRGEWVLLLNLP